MAQTNTQAVTASSWIEQIQAQAQNSLASLWSWTVAQLPQLVGALALVLFGLVLALILRVVVRRGLAGVGLDALGDKLLQIMGFSAPSVKPSGLISRLVFWAVFLGFIVMAAQVLGLDSVTQTISALVSFVPSVIAALIIITIGILVGDMAKSAIAGALGAMGLDFAEPLARSAQVAIVVLVGMAALDVLGVDTGLVQRIIEIVLIASGAALALAVGFGARETAASLVAGLYIRDLFHPGDTIKTDEIEGEVIAITPTTTMIETSDGAYLHIANAKLAQQNTRVFGATDEFHRE